jgi:hypothetical protein
MERRAEARRKLLALAPAIKAEIGVALRQGANQIAASARAFAPAGWSDLRASIKVADSSYKPANSNVRGVSIGAVRFAGQPDLAVYVVAGDDKAWYARLFEHGLSRSWVQGGMFAGTIHPGLKAQPYFFPAYRAHKRSVRLAVNRATRKAARAVASGG